jgi:hypothetical protein
MNAQPMAQRVPLSQTACNYGGARSWFHCPRCSARVAKLYLRESGFLCRGCHRIAYASQSEDPIGRAWRAQQKIERRLSEDWERPSGMHRSTYERLIARICKHEETREDALCGFIERNLGGLL